MRIRALRRVNLCQKGRIENFRRGCWSRAGGVVQLGLLGTVSEKLAVAVRFWGPKQGHVGESF